MSLIADGVTDNSAAMAALLASAPDNSAIALPAGIVCLATGLAVTGRTGVCFVGGVIKLTGAAARSLGTLGNFGIVFDGCASSGFCNTVFLGNGNGPVVGFKNCADSGMSGCDVSGAGYGYAQIASILGSRAKFTGNNIHDSAGSDVRGMWIGNVQTTEIDTGGMIAGNHVFNNSASGIVYVGVGGIVSNNNSKGNNGAGIVISGNADAHSSGVTVTANVCSANAFHGIQVGDSGDMTHQLAKAFCASGGSVVGNSCFANTNAGIFVADAAGWSLNGNTCFDNGLNGIQADTNLYDIAINANVLFDSRVGTARMQQIGIKMIGNNADTFQNVTVNGNVCTNHKYYGIMGQSNATAYMRRLSIVGNSCNANDSTGIFLAEASVGHVIGVLDGNSCYGNASVDIRATTTAVKIGDNSYLTSMGF